MDSIRCEECGKVHRDGDPIEVRSDGYGISVTCEAHAIWANRRAIKDLIASANPIHYPDD